MPDASFSLHTGTGAVTVLSVRSRVKKMHSRNRLEKYEALV